MIYDVAIIGCGVVGAACARELSQYDCSVLILEASTDVANATSKANSGILHAGYDPLPGSLMAASNVRGARLARDICARLDVPYQQNGAMILAFSAADQAHLEMLLERGLLNGVEGLEIMSGAAARQREPALSPEVIAVLWAPGSAIVDPWEYTLAMAEVAVQWGAQLRLETRVTEITVGEKGFAIRSSDGSSFHSRYIINSAGNYAPHIHELIGGSGLTPLPTRGQYHVFDKSAGELVSATIFQCPGKEGKGVLVAPTVHGNLLAGPDYELLDDPDDVATSAKHLRQVFEQAQRSVPALPAREIIRNFSGNRAKLAGEDDFVVSASPVDRRFINLAGIASPGLTAAPALAELARELLGEAGMTLTCRPDWHEERSRLRMRYLSQDEQQQRIELDPAYGRIVCRCELITEGEIRDAIRAPIPARTIDAVKRHSNAGSGRCQGGFCGTRVHALLAEELGISFEQVLRDLPGSYEVLKPTRSPLQDIFEEAQHD